MNSNYHQHFKMSSHRQAKNVSFIVKKPLLVHSFLDSKSTVLLHLASYFIHNLSVILHSFHLSIR